MLKLIKNSIYIKLLDDFCKSIVFKTISVKFFEAIIIFLISLIVIRYLGPTDYGRLNYIFSIITILRPIYIFGMPAVLQAKLARDKKFKVYKIGEINKTNKMILIEGGKSKVLKPKGFIHKF